jgi:hypothetical protein
VSEHKGVNLSKTHPHHAEDPREFRTLDAFVRDFLAVVYARQVTDQHSRAWCPQWWQHSEAFVRLDALWHAYEYMRRDERTGLDVWWIHHADPHMARLFDPQGPFKYCSVRGGHKPMVPNLEVANHVRPSGTAIASLEFATLDDFVNNWLTAAYARQVTDAHHTVWCPEWRKHPEAVSRLTALWHSFGYQREKVWGLSDWWVRHADPQMARLFDPQGTFRYCSIRNGHRDMLPPLPIASGSEALSVEPTPEELARYVNRK